MSTATVRLNDRCAITLDAVSGNHRDTTKGVLLSIEGRCPGDVMNCAVIPTDKICVLIASLELVQKQLKG